MGISAGDAEDVAQETLIAFAKAFREGRYDRDKGRLSSWLFGIAYNHVLRQRRRGARPEDNPPDPGGPSGFWSRVPDDRVTGLWTRHWQEFLLTACLRRARAEFSEDTFRLFELTVLRENTAEEASELAGVPIKTVYNAKHRVLKRMRELNAAMEDAEFPGS
jgi:RNA polymerase sigma-70 factor (ECF subfamily)